MFKRLSIAAVFFLLTVVFLNPVFAGSPFDSATAITDAEQNFGYSNTSKNGDDIHYITNAALNKITSGDNVSYGFLTYGEPHGDQKDGQSRYIGYTYYGEDYTNMTFPPDQNANGADFASASWISKPWEEPTKSAIAVSDPKFSKFNPVGMPGDGDPAYHKAILAGILCYGSLSNNGYKIDTASNPDFWSNIEQYCHILAPPSNYAFGIGRMWHYSNGSLWYVTVPIAPQALLNNHFAIKSIDSGCPQNANGDYVAKAGQKYIATVTAIQLGTDNATKIPVAGLHNIGGTGTQGIGKYNYSTGEGYGYLVSGGKWYSSTDMKDNNGQALQQGDFYNILFGETNTNFYIPNLGFGETFEYKFSWTASNGPTDFISGVIDTHHDADNPIGMSILNLENNRSNLEIPVNIQAPQLVVTPSTATINVGDTKKYTANYYPQGQQAGNGQDVTNFCIWKLPDNNIASIGTNNAIATGKAQGTTQVTASYTVNGTTLQGQAQLKVQGQQTNPPPQSNNTNGGLTFQAVSQDGSQNRDPNKAKWTDHVTATLKLPVQTKVTKASSVNYKTTVAPPSPPSGGDCSTNYTQITGWHIVSADLSYPKQNPQFTFGHPLPPIGTVTMPMTASGQKATATFKELWAEDGAYIYDVFTDSLINQEPKDYPITASNIVVRVDYDIVTFHEVCSKDDCWCESKHSQSSYTQTLNPVTGQLLVYGTGVNSRAQ